MSTKTSKLVAVFGALALLGAVPRACDVSIGRGTLDLAKEKQAYLRYATETLTPTNPISVLAHLTRERLDRNFRLPAASVPADAWEVAFNRIATLADLRDFDELTLLAIVLEHRNHPALAPGLADRAETALLQTKFWFTEPTPAGLKDTSYYFSENHAAIFSVIELIVGERYGSVTMQDGASGEEHRVRADARLREWMSHRARFGFSEWNSDVYYQKDVIAMLSLRAWTQDEQLRTLASQTLDTLFLDMALRTFQGAFSATSGRSYKQDKTDATKENTWQLTKIAFNNATEGFTSRVDAGGVWLAGSNYALPTVLRQIATSEQVFVDRARQSLPIPELPPIDANVAAPYGLSYTDPAAVPLWFGMGAMAAWPVIPLTIKTFEQHQLWANPFFAPLAVFRAYAAAPEAARPLAAQFAPVANMYLMSEANTYTWRSPAAMLSSVQDHRKGFASAQVHPWQATLGAQAVVFTTHPFSAPIATDVWTLDPETGGYWNGQATLPRTGQYRNVAVHIYSPAYPPRLPPPADKFTYLPFTHAYFPQDRFDEVTRSGSWWFARKGDGYVALYSQRATSFAPLEGAATGGHTLPFDLVAAGSPQNVWIVECGSRQMSGTFAEFVAAVSSAPVQVSPTLDVNYASPSIGQVTFSWSAPLVVEGQTVELSGYPRYDNPWVEQAFDTTIREVRSDDAGSYQDFAQATRINASR